MVVSHAEAVAAPGINVEFSGNAGFLESHVERGAAFGAQAIIVGVNQERGRCFLGDGQRVGPKARIGKDEEVRAGAQPIERVARSLGAPVEARARQRGRFRLPPRNRSCPPGPGSMPHSEA